MAYIYPPGSTVAQSNLPIYFYSNTAINILKDTDNLTDKFYNGYQDLYNNLKSSYYNVPDSDARMYWLKNAVEINSNNAYKNPSDPLGYSNTFIRSVTRSGLLYDGSADLGNVDAMVQSNSDLIGKYVLGSIFGYADGDTSKPPSLPITYSIPGIDDFIQKDIGSALSKGHQSIQGWGGSFNYWNTPFDTMGSIGNQIYSNINKYEEFLAINAKAIANVIAQDVASIITPINAIISEINMFSTSLSAQVPLSVTADLTQRLIDSIQYGYGGSPNLINGYTATLNSSGNVTGWFYSYGDGFVTTADATQAANLNSIRAVRLQDQLGTPGAAWQSDGTVVPHTVLHGLIAQASAATLPQTTGLNASNFQLLAAARSLENQSLTLNVLPTGSALSTVQTSGANAPTALFGTAAIVNGQLVYTPKQDFVGNDFVSFTTFDGTTYKSSVVPLTVQGFVHQTSGTASDGSTTTKYFGAAGQVVGGRTVYADGSYDVLSYAVTGGQTYLAERNTYSKAGAAVTTTDYQADGYVSQTVDRTAGTPPPLSVAAGGSLTVNTPGTSVTANGPGDTINFAANWGSASIGSGSVNVWNNAGATLNGGSNTVTFYANGTGFVSGSNNTIIFAGIGSTVETSNAALTFWNQSTAMVYGSANTALMYNNATLWSSGAGNVVNVAGTGDTVSIANGTIALWNGAGATVNGNGNAVTLYDQTSLTAGGAGDAIFVAGKVASVSASAATVAFYNGASGTVTGTGNHLVLNNTDTVTATGTSISVTIQGTGDVLSTQSASIGLSDKSAATVTGQGNTFNLYGGSTLVVSGTGEAFVFAAHPGTSTISGYDASDSFQFSTSTFANWQALLGQASQSGANTVIHLDPTSTLTLAGVALTSLKASQFHFM